MPFGYKINISLTNLNGKSVTDKYTHTHDCHWLSALFLKKKSFQIDNYIVC